ncbi:hypothetical protein BX666DRAFT_2072668 [Dichotomocladium elegans]|nr:hypothetical protein BX666DRAFT_2072668 [Dichotomocladium elegans]
MRTFSILIFLLVTLSFCLAASPASIINESSLEKRQEQNGPAHSPSEGATQSNHANAPTATGGAAPVTSSPASSAGGHGEQAPKATTTNKNSGKTMFATPAILTTGTLFYIGIAITFVLWCTGFALDFLTDRQEQLAYKLALSKKHCGLSPEFPATLKA